MSFCCNTSAPPRVRLSCDNVPSGLKKPCYQLAHTAGNMIKKDKDDVTALVMNCIDFRLIKDTARLMTGKGLAGDYDNFILPGAALGIFNPDWQKSFDDTVNIAVQLHKIKKVIIVDHMDCGYYHHIFNNFLETGIKLSDSQERQLHYDTLRQVVPYLKANHPTLDFEGYLIELDGSAKRLVY